MPSRDVLKLARDSDCSAYDCEFVVLANSLDVKLMTMDKKVLKGKRSTNPILT